MMIIDSTGELERAVELLVDIVKPSDDGCSQYDSVEEQLDAEADVIAETVAALQSYIDKQCRVSFEKGQYAMAEKFTRYTEMLMQKHKNGIEARIAELKSKDRGENEHNN